MGYTTDFEGAFTLDEPLTEEQAAYLTQFCETRRMARDPKKASKLPDAVREGVDLPVGTEGEFFVGGSGSYGQGNDYSVLDHNRPPSTQPGLWCQWVPTDDNQGLMWDGGEKFYSYVEWLQYIIENFLKRWGLTLNGEVRWSGEDTSDVGLIKVKDNVVSVHDVFSDRTTCPHCGGAL